VNFFEKREIIKIIFMSLMKVKIKEMAKAD